MTPAKFNSLPKPQRRVIIAKDVIRTLKLPARSRYGVERGSYLSGDIGSLRVGRKTTLRDARTAGAEIQLQDLLPKIEKHCEVCALGAMFIGHVRVANSVTLGAVYCDYSNYLSTGRTTVTAPLEAYFSSKQLDLIEDVFEDSVYVFPRGEKIIQKWALAISDPTARLLAICQNIVRNKGTFKVSQVPAPVPAKKKKRKAA